MSSIFMIFVMFIDKFAYFIMILLCYSLFVKNEEQRLTGVLKEYIAHQLVKTTIITTSYDPIALYRLSISIPYACG